MIVILFFIKIKHSLFVVKLNNLHSKTLYFGLLKQLAVIGIVLFIATQPMIEVTLYLSNACCDLTDVYYELTDLIEEEEHKKENLEDKIKEHKYYSNDTLSSNKLCYDNKSSLEDHAYWHKVLFSLEYYLDVPSPPPELA